MNKFLASAIGTINALIAWVLILVPPLAGAYSAGPPGLIAGLLIGFVLAVVLCGLLALLIDIRDSLREIAGRDAAESQPENKEPPWKHA